MRRFGLIFLMLAALAACGGTPAAAPAPTAAPTAVPLDQIDLEPLLIQSGDLPAGLTGAQVLDTAPPAYAQMKMPDADRLLFQRLQRDGNPAGYVVVSLYREPARRDDAYGRLTADIRAGAAAGGAAQTPPDVGEAALMATNQLVGPHLAFWRCAAVVSVLMSGADAQEATAYAKRLDKRLRTVVC